MPLTMDVFNADAFSAIEMTGAIERTPYLPNGLGTLNIFMPNPITTDTLMVEEIEGELNVIPTSPRGSPPSERPKEKRKARHFGTPRIAEETTVYAHELQGVRAFGSTTELMQLQHLVARRLNGPVGLTSKIEYTHEYMRLGAVSGILLDANGSTIYNWFDEFGISQPAEIDFDLDNASPASGALIKKCTTVIRAVQRAAKGAFVTGTRVHGMCGDAFWDDLINHPEVRATYLNQMEARQLREGQAFRTFDYGDITWFNYRGSDDNSEITVGTDKVKFFPVGAPGVFEVAYSPAETFDFVNTPGKKTYVIPIIDRDRNAWWKAEVYSYPLFICKRPEVLQRGKRT